MKNALGPSLLFLMIVWCAPAAAVSSRIDLHSGWNLQSGCKIQAAGEQISTSRFATKGWYETSVPATVLAAQVASGEFPDLFVGMNLRKLPGMDYPVGGLFPLLAMSPDSPYACSWWYRKEFRLPNEYASRNVWLNFEGINYRANVWLNGRKLADSKDVAGTYRTYEFDATTFLKAGQPNVLAVEVFAPTEKDLAMNWWDWAPTPPDKNMGLWRGVYLTDSGPVRLQYPAVVSHVSEDLSRADLTLIAELRNASDKPLHATVDASIPELHISLQQEIDLQPGAERTITFAPEKFPPLRIREPKLWWPASMGHQPLHSLIVRVLAAGKISDEQRIRFGIRDITSELTERGFRLFRINGRRLLIRGGGWTPDLLLRESSDRLNTELRYTLDMGLNTIRLEGKMESDEFFDRADEMGILVMAGWMCCDIWQYPDKWPPENLQIAAESLRSQSLRMRHHASVLTWLNGSDEPPPPNVERAFLKVLEETSWPNPIISAASQADTVGGGPSGMKMTGPYDWVPPSYWYLDRQKFGGAFGFNTETSPGPAIPPLQSLRRFIPPDHLWPIDRVWNFHAGGENYTNMDKYNQALDAVYGPSSGVEQYAIKSQAMAYDGERAIFEAYARNKYVSTGVIQWMLNNAWPSLIWHLYDYYLQPAGGYFGTKKANEPLHIQYSYDDHSVVVVNNLYQPAQKLTATADVYDFNLQKTFSRQETIDVDADSTRAVLSLPLSAQTSGVYFAKLSLRDRAGKLVSSNFYWLPTKEAAIAWDRTKDTVYTPVDAYEDLTALNDLPRVRVEATATANGSGAIRVKLHNPSHNLAFQVHVGIGPSGSNDEFLPVLWDDNYVSLLPGESQTVEARYLSRNALHGHAVVRVDGWNVEPITIPLTTPAASSPVHGN
jgi:exo-1,4-beta-D-glucosaminidase